MTLTADTPGAHAPAPFKRRSLLALPLCAVSLLPACGGDHRIEATPETAPQPLSALRYDRDEISGVVGETISANQAHLSGGSGSAIEFSITPDLPAGLSLDPVTGLISGTPTVLQRPLSHEVSARNAAGSVQAAIRIGVTGGGKWRAIPTVPGARYQSSQALLPDGRLLVAGGHELGVGASASAQIFDPSSNSWSAAPLMLVARIEASAVALRDGRVLVFGGFNAAGRAVGSVEIFDGSVWTATGSLVQARANATVNLLDNGQVIVTGGSDRTPVEVFRDSVELYDPGTGAWTLLPTRLSAARKWHAAALLPGGRELLVAGGVGTAGRVGTAEVYAVDGSASAVIPYAGLGDVHKAVALRDGSVLVISEASPLAQRFHPASSTWTTSTMLATRERPTMNLLDDGRVLVAGGFNLNSAEIYDPDLNLWTAAEPMASGRRDAVAAVLKDGSVLVVGGFASALHVNASERYWP